MIAERVVTGIVAGVRILMNAKGDYVVLYRQESLAPERPLDPIEFPFFARVFRAGSTGPGTQSTFLPSASGNAFLAMAQSRDASRRMEICFWAGPQRTTGLPRPRSSYWFGTIR